MAGTVTSTSRVQIEYSLCTAVIGYTACARRSRSEPNSQTPR
jgi:hypothetical protein